MKLVPHRQPSTAVLVLLAALFAAPATSQTNKPLHRDGWILAAVHAPGNQGSIWRTDLWIFSKEYFGTVDLYFCQTGQDNTDVQPQRITFNVGRVQYFEDAVDHFLNLNGASWLGALHYSATMDVQVWARVYSISPDGTKSYGQLIEGIPTTAMSPSYNDDSDNHKRQYVYATRHTSSGRYRVNFGVVNPTAISCDYSVRLYTSSGNTPPTGMASVPITVPPYSMVQLTDPFAAVNGGEWNDYEALLLIHTSGGGGFLYASVVDNATNDAFFVRGVKDRNAAEGGGLNETLHTRGWLLAGARAPGLEGSIWRTDLWINIQSVTASSYFQIRFCESGKDNSQAPWLDVPLTPGKFRYYAEDVVEQYLHVGDTPWVGSIQYRCSTNAQAWARVYSISPDGTASYGQLVEGVPADDMSPPSGAVETAAEYQWLVAAKHTANNRFRVNVGVINPTSVACHYYVAMYTKDGESDPFVEVDVPPYSMIQLGDPFATVDGGEWNEKLIRVQPSTASAGGFAYLSVVDNATNDAFFVRGIKLLPYPTP